jgi:hypothetical protein
VENTRVNEATYRIDEDRFSAWPRFWMEEGRGAEEATAGISDEIAHEEWAVGSACYMCHACTNFGVHGKEGRPCAKGLSDLINRRHKARLSAQAARRKGV